MAYAVGVGPHGNLMMIKRDLHENWRFSKEKLQKVGLFANEQLFLDLYCLEPGQAQKVHQHQGSSKFYLVLQGRALVQIGDEEQSLEAGQLSLASAGELHGVRNETSERVVLLVGMAPPPSHASK